MKHTKDELVYLMKFYQIKNMPVYYNGRYVGKVTDKLEYYKGYALSYLTHSQYAIDIACDSIDEYIDAIKNFKSTEKVVIEIDTYVDYKYQESHKIEGTYDSIFADFDRANNRLRYCNGHYHRFKDKEIDKLYRLWGHWIPESRGMDLYYGNGVVD